MPVVISTVVIFIIYFGLLVVMFGLFPVDNEAGPWKLYGELLLGAAIMTLAFYVVKYSLIAAFFVFGV